MADGIYTIQAPVVIMDDSSFAMYCEQIGVSSAENGSVVLNRIWDNINSNFRYKEYVPFLSENQDTMTLQNPNDATAAVVLPVLGFTQEPPVLREEYNNYALVQFVSLSTWKQIGETIGNAEPDTCIRILSERERTLTELNAIETELTNVLDHNISFEIENRIQEKIDKRRHAERIQTGNWGRCVSCWPSSGSPTYFPTRWDLSGIGKENLPDICPSA